LRIMYCMLAGILVVFPLLIANAEVIEGIAAVVNDGIITYSEVETRVKATPNGEDLRKEILEELIEKKLLLSEAEEEGVMVYDEEIEKNLEMIKTKFASEEEFQSQLREENLTQDEFKDALKDKMLLNKLIDFRIRSKIQAPTEEEVKKFFEENRERFKDDQKDFPEVQKEIETFLYRLKMEKALDAWVKELKEKAYIRIIDISPQTKN